MLPRSMVIIDRKVRGLRKDGKSRMLKIIWDYNESGVLTVV